MAASVLVEYSLSVRKIMTKHDIYTGL